MWWEVYGILFGINVIYFIAALNNVPEECYEAAKIDGATKWQTFKSIQLPLMAPVMQTILLLSINGTLHVGEYVYVMTGGAPGGTTHTVMSYLLSKYTPGDSRLCCQPRLRLFAVVYYLGYNVSDCDRLFKAKQKDVGGMLITITERRI